MGLDAVMELVEQLYEKLPGKVSIRRVADDDWHQETLPILLNLDEPGVAERTILENHPRRTFEA